MSVTNAGGAAGYLSPNYVINGAFDFWQRGTSFTNPADSAYLADRWTSVYNGSGSTRSFSRQAFTPGSSPIPGWDGSYFSRYQSTVAGTGGTYFAFLTKLEDATILAGQTATLSFWAKADTTRTMSVTSDRAYGTGGSTGEYPSFSWGNASLTTTWQKFSFTVSIPSVSGKTIGANSYLGIVFNLPLNSTFTFDLWGVQLEAGTVATPFRRNANSLQGELAACQRYFERFTPSTGAIGHYWTTTNFYGVFPYKITKRIAPNITVSALTGVTVWNGGTGRASTNLAFNSGNELGVEMLAVTASVTAGQAGNMIITAGNYIDASAEL